MVFRRPQSRSYFSSIQERVVVYPNTGYVGRMSIPGLDSFYLGTWTLTVMMVARRVQNQTFEFEARNLKH